MGGCGGDGCDKETALLHNSMENIALSPCPSIIIINAHLHSFRGLQQANIEETFVARDSLH